MKILETIHALVLMLAIIVIAVLYARADFWKGACEKCESKTAKYENYIMSERK